MASGCNGTTDKPKLYIQGFVPASGDVFTSETVVPASSVACREVNNDTSILSDYELVIQWSDTMVSCNGRVHCTSSKIKFSATTCIYEYMYVHVNVHVHVCR